MNNEDFLKEEEFNQLLPSLLQAKTGCFLIVPLKYETSSFNMQAIKQNCKRFILTTSDINENVKALLNQPGDASIGTCYFVNRDFLLSNICNEFTIAHNGFQVLNKGKCHTFDILDSYLYIFHTQVAFLCLGLSFDRSETLELICNPGYAKSDARFSYLKNDKYQNFSMEEFLTNFCDKLKLHKFFDGDSSYLLDAYAYTLALVPKRFKTTEAMRQITFNLHQMAPLNAPIQDNSEEDIRYVYAVKNQPTNSYRWGCCVSFQTISYVVADKEMNFEKEMYTQACDGLPVVLLALYEKYTCLRFTELISKMDNGNRKQLKALKKLMLRFRAFGTVTPANLSRWHNVKQIYAYFMEVNDIHTAIQDISNKVNILSEHQQELDRARNEAVVNIITLFGIISILGSVLSIVQILSGGNSLLWLTTALTAAILVLVMGAAIRITK
ncbi:MAG: hypothetical protein ACI4U3_09675 [Traorella sp.]